MKIKDLQQELLDMVNGFKFFSEKEIEDHLIKVIYERRKGDLVTTLMSLQQKDRDEMEAKLRENTNGTLDAIHTISSVAGRLLEDKTSRGAKGAANYFFNDAEGFPMLITTAKSLFPKGIENSYSNGSQWWLDKFTKLLIARKDDLSHGGESRQWAIRHDHASYIDMCLKQCDDIYGSGKGISDEDLLSVYRKGWKEELDSRPDNTYHGVKKVAYSHGCVDAEVGDDSPSVNSQTDEAIVKAIRDMHKKNLKGLENE